MPSEEQWRGSGRQRNQRKRPSSSNSESIRSRSKSRSSEQRAAAAAAAAAALTIAPGMAKNITASATSAGVATRPNGESTGHWIETRGD